MSFFLAHDLDQPAGFGLPEDPYPAEFEIDPTRWGALELALNTIHIAAGVPLMIKAGGGWRSVEYNRRLYAARNERPTDSQHSQGRAADIYSKVLGADILHDITLKLYKAGNVWIGGLGQYNTFIHVDVRVNWDHLARWDLRTKLSKNS